MNAVTLKQFSQQENIPYVTCVYRVRKLNIAPVSVDLNHSKRGVKALLFKRDDLEPIKERTKQVIKDSNTITLRLYAELKKVHRKTLAMKVYWANLDCVAETPAITGCGRKARLFNIKDLDRLYQ